MTKQAIDSNTFKQVDILNLQKFLIFKPTFFADSQRQGAVCVPLLSLHHEPAEYG